MNTFWRIVTGARLGALAAVVVAMCGFEAIQLWSFAPWAVIVVGTGIAVGALAGAMGWAP